MANSDIAQQFIRESIPVPLRCRKCGVYPLCRAGGCKRTQLSEDYCRAYQTFFTACLPLFRVFLREKPPQNAGQ
jgi:radical SAM protein with 4Fe4S-binding SPASM domain